MPAKYLLVSYLSFNIFQSHFSIGFYHLFSCLVIFHQALRFFFAKIVLFSLFVSHFHGFLGYYSFRCIFDNKRHSTQFLDFVFHFFRFWMILAKIFHNFLISFIIIFQGFSFFLLAHI